MGSNRSWALSNPRVASGSYNSREASERHDACTRKVWGEACQIGLKHIQRIKMRRSIDRLILSTPYMSSLNLARRLLLSATSQVLPRHDISTSDVSSTRAHTSIDEQDAVNTGADMPLLDIDLDALARDLNALRDELREQMGEEDLKHLKKMVRWGRAASFVGWATSGIIPNPISPLLMSSANFSRWAMIAHHVLHRGYDKVEGTPGHYTSKGFAKGARRILDWMDWIEPEAWVHEHNFQHHYKLGEAHDPDQPELNLEFLRNSKLPMSLRYAVVGFFSITWKYLYYAPNTHGELHYHKLRKKEQGERLDLFGQIQDILIEDIPRVPLFEPAQQVAMKDDIIGFGPRADQIVYFHSLKTV